MKTKPLMLMILDGYGVNPEKYGNAILHAHKPSIDRIFETYPNTLLGASGLDVGLPEGQMGNSEVGHLNIGAGRIVYQELTRITKSIKDGDFFENKALLEAVDHVKKNGSALHIMGLLSDGGVHSHMTHLCALIDLAKQNGLSEVYLHAFLDGRDVPPRSAGTYISQIQQYMAEKGTGKLATVSGRYYAMDRDNRFERVVLAYDALTLGEAILTEDPFAALEDSYNNDASDEFVKPFIITENGKVTGRISDNDAVVMYNFRPDRAREITRTFADKDFSGFERKVFPKNLKYICMTQYDASMPNVTVAFPPEKLENTLGEYLSSKGLHQLRIAETEKYAHVTFFFNGGVEAPNKNEERILVPSPKVATYDLQPEMSAFEVTEKVLDAIVKDIYDVIILNFANPDMVGHTGVFDAAVKAIEALDICIPKIVGSILDKEGTVLITADHGNCDYMLNEKGEVVTAHSVNKVPFLVASGKGKEIHLREDGVLADIAPTMLELLNISQPKEMTGRSLIK
ncbi:MAG: 2,3-bisphosphoglycerate-independent phosphoglycerate mutase [Firmicutes bacterium]|nr:2,3-bisphosphoglycerate-independent phosphoglycerate mutase [Bacillota bacterium]